MKTKTKWNEKMYEKNDDEEKEKKSTFNLLINLMMFDEQTRIYTQSIVKEAITLHSQFVN